MSGSPIKSEDEVDVEAIIDLQDRFVSIEDLRVTILAAAVALWLIVTALALAVTRGRVARPALQLLALFVVWLPLASLIGHAVGGEWTERLIVYLLPPLLPSPPATSSPATQASPSPASSTALA